ncbi:MAG: 50S ribosomal protein L3, partial [bacterium]|nr:50S ribosomal protein L3 [bacterium]
MKFLLGKKISMSQVFIEGKVLPVTLIEANPCQVTQIKTKDKDGYFAVQVGLDKLTKASKIKKPMKGKEYRYLREFRADEGIIKDYEIGKVIDANVFSEGDKVKVSGISKGKGYQGAVKKWGFHGRLS